MEINPGHDCPCIIVTSIALKHCYIKPLRNKTLDISSISMLITTHRYKLKVHRMARELISNHERLNSESNMNFSCTVN